MRIFFPVLFLVLFTSSAFANKTDSLLAVLKTELAKKNVYDSQKEGHLKKLKLSLANTAANNYIRQYNICSELYEEYKVYQFDSAYVYTQKLLNVSKKLNDLPKQYESRIRLGFILLSSGMFKETFECLDKINTHLLNDSSKLEFYNLKARACSDLGDYNADLYYSPVDNATSIKYLDSAIAIAGPNSFDKLARLGDKQIRLGQIQQPSPYYVQILRDLKLTAHQRAMIATGLSTFYPGKEKY